MRELNLDEMDKINGGDSIIDSVMGIFKKKKKQEFFQLDMSFQIVDIQIIERLQLLTIFLWEVYMK